MFQRAKKVVSDSPGLLDFATGLVISILNLPDGQMRFWAELKLQENCTQCSSKIFFGLVEMTFGLIRANYSFPESQAVELTFFAPCVYTYLTSSKK